MSAEALVEKLFLNSDEPIDWYFETGNYNPESKHVDNLEAINFETGLANAHMELYINGHTFKSSDGHIVFKDGGKVTIKINDASTIYPNQTYNVRLKVFDDDHPLGRYLVHEDKERSCAEFKVVD